MSGSDRDCRVSGVRRCRRICRWAAGAFGRAIQQPALTFWDGQDTNRGRAQHAIQQRAKANRDARRGKYAHTAALVHT
jgi:fructose-bisphosphate aldolase class I